MGVGNTLLSMVLMFALEGLGYGPPPPSPMWRGRVMSFFLNRSFTFRSQGPWGRSAVKFALNVAVCYLAAYGIAQPVMESFPSRCLSPPSGGSG